VFELQNQQKIGKKALLREVILEKVPKILVRGGCFGEIPP